METTDFTGELANSAMVFTGVVGADRSSRPSSSSSGVVSTMAHLKGIVERKYKRCSSGIGYSLLD